jgi:hypothetical protein
MKKTQAIKNLLLNLTHSDLADLYNFNIECQVNVAQENGTRIEGEYKGKHWQGWTDGINTWKSFRIPWNASTEPEYIDTDIRFDLAIYTEGIGLTGWDWVNKISKWVAFDFDSIISHKSGLSLNELNLIEEKAFNIPWVTVRKSTSGNGLHLYIFIEPVKTINHNEHAALARAILGQMSAITGFDFTNKVDICGGNMWIWHRKMKGTDGLKLIRQGEILTDIPSNWKDHVKVIRGYKRKVSIFKESTEQDKLFEELTGQNIKEPLDNEHQKVINYLKNNNCTWWWDQDNNMLVTHTSYLKQAHIDLQLKGIFDTVSIGKDTPDHNCFCFPIRKGGWIIRRFTPGVKEHDSWDQDGMGWTRCYYNIKPDLSTAARNCEGVEHPQGGYVFRDSSLAQKAASILGADFNLPPWALGRTSKLKTHKDGRLIAELDKATTDNTLPGWVAERGKWKRLFNVNFNNPMVTETRNFDDVLRHLVTEQHQDCGWVVKSDNQWVQEPVSHVKYALKSLSLTEKEVGMILGDNIFKRWVIVNKPFHSEYPGNRQWNRDACQLQYLPSKTDKLHYPTWLKILDHVGKNLTDTLESLPWARANGINIGTDYLKCWIASIFQKPEEPLPYLFLFGPESSGKSMFHEALSLLITHTGYQRAENALRSQQGFNSELKNSIICVVEEINLSQKNNLAYTRIKDWVTSQLLPIHPKGGTPYLTRNTTHWIQCSNDRNACPVFPGDTRITMIYVEPIPDWENKSDIINRLKKEAPDFLGEIMRIELPKSPDRLNIPVISTNEKMILQRQNQSALEQFIEEYCHYAPGYTIKLSAFWEEFVKWLDPAETYNWSRHKISKHLPLPYVKGRLRDSHHYLGNISFESQTEQRKELTVLDGRLVAK